MQTKLTLRIEKPLIKAAKNFSKKQGKSLSQLVSDYFHLITEQEQVQGLNECLPPLTLSLKGVLQNSQISEEVYKKFIEDKYR